MPPRFLSIKNFEKYQHYKDRNPPWVKLYWDILSDDKFVMLDLYERGLYCHLILLASRHGNYIPDDPEYIRLQLKLSTSPDLTRLKQDGFLLAVRYRRHHRSASKPLARDAAPSTEREFREQSSENRVQSSERESEKTEGRKKEKNCDEGTASPPKSGATWQAYAAAYRTRYGVEPVRNQTVNSLLCRLVAKLGQDEAPKVAAFYLTHSGQWYVSKMHPVNLLVADAEKLRTEWATGQPMTQAKAAQADQTATRGAVFTALLDKERRQT